MWEEEEVNEQWKEV